MAKQMIGKQLLNGNTQEISCNNCDNILNINDNFCSKCGANADDIPAMESELININNDNKTNNDTSLNIEGEIKRNNNDNNDDNKCDNKGDVLIVYSWYHYFIPVKRVGNQIQPQGQMICAYLVILILLISITVGIIIPNVRKARTLRKLNELNDQLNVDSCFPSGLPCLINGDCCSGTCCMNECVSGNDCYLSYGDECIRYPTHCNSDEDLTCQNGVCLDCSSVRDDCTHSTECCSGLACKNGNCVYENGCGTGPACISGLTCQNGVCLDCRSLRDDCTHSTECCSGLTCKNGNCVYKNGCGTGPACESPKVCYQNQCTKFAKKCKGSNDYCDHSSECCTGYCRNGNFCA